jgi:hypothetical protein
MTISQQSNRYTFIVLTESETDNLSSMEELVGEFQEEHTDKINLYKLEMNNPVEKDFIEKYGLMGAPTPFLLVMSPGEVITGGFPSTASQDQLVQSINLSSLILTIMKSMQERKIALVCFQNKSTNFNSASTKAVEEFKNAPGYEDLVDIITTDPMDPDSSDFLSQAGLTKDIKEAAVVFVMPPGRIIQIYSGKITKADLEKSLSACTSGSGCCPAPK